MAQLKELVDIYLGVTHTPKYVETGVPFLSVKDISGGEIRFDDCKYISEDEYNSLAQGAKPQVGDMLFCRVGTIGKPIIIPEGTPKFGSFVSLGYLRNKDENICDLEYLRYWMYSKSFERQVYANVKGASQVNLNTGWLSKFEVTLPDILMQGEIVKKLDKCVAVIKKKKQELLELDNLIKSRFVEMFGDPVSNSKGLKELTLPELGELGRGVSKHRPRNAPELLG
ncbi:MAG: restriction endonuclease subunit S, partial [Lachnospiraceae bacterium]|nr:restriction endonuclease subunit S [Lachnospiraceae bacterium]